MAKPAKTKTNRAAIVEAALAAFIEDGFHQAGVRDIAKRAGVSLGNLYNHFPAKDALIAEIAQIEAQEIAQMIEGLSKHVMAMDAVCAFAKALLLRESQPENAVLTADLTSEAMRNPIVADVFEANGARINKELTDLIQRGVDAGEMQPPISVKNCVALICDTARSAGMRAAFEGTKSVKSAIKAQDTMIRRLLS